PDFQLVADFRPTGDQPQAIDKLAAGLQRGDKHQTLLGATGTGKSLAPDEPVLVGREDDYGRVTWSVEPIGPIVDQAIANGPTVVTPDGSEVVFSAAGRPGMVVATVDPRTHASVVRPVTAYSRHGAPSALRRVTTTDGRAVAVTGDHNFVRLG